VLTVIAWRACLADLRCEGEEKQQTHVMCINSHLMDALAAVARLVTHTPLRRKGGASARSWPRRRPDSDCGLIAQSRTRTLLAIRIADMGLKAARLLEELSAGTCDQGGHRTANLPRRVRRRLEERDDL